MPMRNQEHRTLSSNGKLTITNRHARKTRQFQYVSIPEVTYCVFLKKLGHTIPNANAGAYSGTQNFELQWKLSVGFRMQTRSPLIDDPPPRNSDRHDGFCIVLHGRLVYSDVKF